MTIIQSANKKPANVAHVFEILTEHRNENLWLKNILMTKLIYDAKQRQHKKRERERARCVYVNKLCSQSYFKLHIFLQHGKIICIYIWCLAPTSNNGSLSGWMFHWYSHEVCLGCSLTILKIEFLVFFGDAMFASSITD